MKLFLILSIVSFSAIASQTNSKKVLPIHKAEEIVKAAKTEKPAPLPAEKKTADCDEKAKKPVEITPSSISLSGNTGCSLDQAH